MSKELAVAIPILLFVVLSMTITAPAHSQTHTDWKTPVNLETINTSAVDAGPLLTLRGSALYFVSNRPGGQGGLDLWVAQRAGGDGPWEAAVNLGTTINSTFVDRCPFVSPDDLRLIFASDRGGTLDFYMSYRENPHDVLGWGPPVRIDAISSSFEEFGPSGFIDPRTGALTVFFNSNRPGGPGGHSIYTATQQSDGTFTTPVLVEELSSSSGDTWPFVRNDGRELFFISNRPGGYGGNDIWVSSRGSLDEPWSAPVNAGPALNTADAEQRASITADGLQMVFFSNRAGGAGGFDMYATTRHRASLIPVAGSVTGAFGRVFRTAARLTNPTDEPISGNLLFRPAGTQPSSTDPVLQYAMAPFETLYYDDLFARFGVTGVGSLEVHPMVGAGPATLVAIDNGSSVVVPEVGREHLLAAGSTAVLTVPDLTRFRFNVGLRTLAAGVVVTLQLHDGAGTLLRGVQREYPPNYFVQSPAAELLDGVLDGGETIIVRVDSGSVVMYGSAVSNGASGDVLQLARNVSE
jgi:hypothetical protein